MFKAAGHMQACDGLLLTRIQIKSCAQDSELRILAEHISEDGGRFQMFYCRELELEKLNRRYQDDQFEFIVIYGRRRVGKTALINEFCQDKKTIYFSALNATAQENLRALSKAIAVCRDADTASFPEYRTYEDAFDEIGRLSDTDRVIFVIDEYPYLARAIPSVSSRIQHLIDHRWANGKMYLILCGSSMSFMQNQVLGYESPLYGRRTAQFKIEPLTYRETAVFHPELSFEQNAFVYGITGGIPHYINRLGIKDSLKSALLSSVFDRSGYLFEEPENLLKQELREPAVYNSIITSIAEGASKMNDICTKVGIDSGACAKYIRTLLELGILKKETPATEKPGKKTIYRIEDNFFRFWYRFVPQNMAAISSGRIVRSFDRLIQNEMHDYMGLIFEKMCQDYLLYYAEDLPVELNSVGQWWGTDKVSKKQIQIDIVGTPIAAGGSQNKEFIIGSCKFRNQKIGADEYELLRSYAAVFGKGQRYYYYIFSLGGFTDALKELAEKGEVRLISLEEMYW